MKLKLDRNTKNIDTRPLNFKPAPGNYRVIFSHFKEVKGAETNKPKMRVYWDILFPNDSEFNYRIWKDYPIENGVVIWLDSDLKNIFGDDLSEFNDDSGALDTDKLIGREAEAKVGTKTTNEYKGTLTIVKMLYPVGTFKFKQSPHPVSA